MASKQTEDCICWGVADDKPLCIVDGPLLVSGQVARRRRMPFIIYYVIGFNWVNIEIKYK